jgi:ubiquinone/menaquinone biosynthesis C-methylase UbiE
MKILDIGCGKNKYKSKNKEDKVIGVDEVKLPGVDVVHNLEKFPWPFKDNEFDEIVAYHVLEHLSDIIRTMEEIWRVGKVNGLVRIKTPFYSSWGQFNDPTHKHFFTPFTFSYFEGKHQYSHEVKKNNPKMNFKVERVKIHFGIGKSKILNKILDPLINLNQKFYSRFFAWILPAAEIEFKLRIIK